jgi:uncharacterized membrane protein YiaA
MQVIILSASLAGLWWARRYVNPRFKMHDGVNDAISGTVQAIGVFYGVTVGLISVGVWNTASAAQDAVSLEASSLVALYRDVRSFPEPTNQRLCTLLKSYTLEIVNGDWPAQRARGEFSPKSGVLLDNFQSALSKFVPKNEGERALFSESLAAFNKVSIQRRLRMDAVENGLSGTMWIVIWFGAVISIGVVFLFHLEDGKLHALLVVLTAGFLGLVLFMIVLNDKPFYGYVAVPTHSYDLVLNDVMQKTR